MCGVFNKNLFSVVNIQILWKLKVTFLSTNPSEIEKTGCGLKKINKGMAKAHVV